jgi:c(7)-type cytochrome triheme protein
MSRFGRLLGAAALLAVASPSRAQMPVFPGYPEPHLYGRVVLDNFSTAAGVPPVAFDHWRHRPMFTCRLCHVDIGFVMASGRTQVSAATNRSKLHCGACHDGRTQVGGRAIFASCSEARTFDGSSSCVRCHRDGSRDLRERFEAFTASFPRGRVDLPDWIDWERLEARTRPLDFLEGVSLRRDRLRNKTSFSIQAKGTWLGNVTFSHDKHSAWNGCEACHPEIFPTTRYGAARYGMEDIVAGEYCGACHNKVAFPIASCRSCHAMAR